MDIRPTKGSEPASSPAAQSPWRGTALALGLALALLAASFSRIAGDTQTLLFHDNVFDSVFAGHILGTALARNIALFGAAMVVLHLVYGLVVLGLARLSSLAWPSSEVRVPHRVFLTFIVLTAWLLASNAYHFPRSSLGNPYANAMQASWLGHSPATWLGAAVALTGAAMLASALWRSLRRGSIWPPSRAGATAAAVVAVAAVSFAVPSSRAQRGPNSPDKPNVVLIGIDSLREDLVARGSALHAMPNLEAFLAQSVSFSNATTPLARTFPSWLSILSGRSPHVTGAVVNLLPRDVVHEGTTLGVLLRKAGYATAYAIDDVRFSNVDATYGFDKTVTPPIGASEFVIGFFADTPLSNLVMNTRVGRVLFPFTSGNRAVATSYDPDSFVQRIASEFDFRQPLFLATHLTLPHWPYSWADAPATKSMEEQKGVRWPDYYINAAHRADEQFAAVVEVLRQRGVLDNAIVIVLSDHGETFGEQGDSLVPVDESAIVSLHAVPTWGHGTSVLSPEQYHVVLAVRSFGRTPLQTKAGRLIDAPVSVEDIAPTITELLTLSPHDPFTGRSLLPLLRNEPGASQDFSGRIRFTETEFNPGQVATQTGKMSPSAIAAAANSYRVDPITDRVEVKRDLIGRLLRERQYAALGNQYLVAAIPTPDGTGFHYFAVDQHGGVPQALSGAPGPQAPQEIGALWGALQVEFGPLLQATAVSAPQMPPQGTRPLPAGSPAARPDQSSDRATAAP